MKPPRVLLVDDDAPMVLTLERALSACGFEVGTAESGEQALDLLGEHTDVVLTDLCMPGIGGIELTRRGRAAAPHAVFVVMSAHGELPDAVEAIKAGADQFLQKPIDLDAVQAVLSTAARRATEHRELSELRATRGQAEAARSILGAHPSVTNLLSSIALVAPSRATVLITGESGTGKELVARAIHAQSGRGGAFVALNCAALAESVLESELFGHERGSFTGAAGRRDGRFKQADGGTLFLDEVSEIPTAIQVKLLRFLQERTFERVGSNKTESVDVRVVAATNRDLAQDVQSGRFREDLYFRLNVVDLNLPPLRARRSDIPLLADHFLLRAAREEQRECVPRWSAAALEILVQYEFPGNVRELQNLAERAIVLCRGEEILPEHLPHRVRTLQKQGHGQPDLSGLTLAELERLAITQSLVENNGSTSRVAQALGISPRTVQYRIKEWGLRPESDEST